MTRINRPATGFTLVELTVVLVIVALLLGGLLLPITAQQDIRQQADAERQLNETRDALIGFAQINGRLPCPATNAVGNGKENCAGPDYGFVPWGEIGVRPTDPWGRMIRYRVSNAFRTAAPPITTATVPDLKIQTRQGNVLTDLTNDAPRDVVFVIVSHGKNGYYGTNADGSAGPPDPAGVTNPDEDTNAGALAGAASTIFVSRTPTPEDAAVIGGFDDLVVWVPRSLLINRMVAAGKL